MRTDVWTAMTAYTPTPRRCSHCALVLAVKKVGDRVFHGCPKCDGLYLSTLRIDQEATP